jgi:hypothetical protein
MAIPILPAESVPSRQAYTITYSNSVEGFPSFYSYIPEQIQGMNQYLYTFKNANLYVHNSNNVDRCTFYEVFTPMSVWSVINDAPTDTKVFKTIVLNSNDTWGFAGRTDMELGNIDSEYFKLKEGDYFAFIRGINNVPVLESELPLRSSQGIGSVSTVDIADPANVVLTYPAKTLNSIISVGDLLYFLSGGVYNLCGVITLITKKVLTVGVETSEIIVDTTTGVGGSTAILPTDYTFFIKNAIAESHGLRGYYMDFIIENDNTDKVEIFVVEADIFKSYP